MGKQTKQTVGEKVGRAIVRFEEAVRQHAFKGTMTEDRVALVTKEYEASKEHLLITIKRYADTRVSTSKKEKTNAQ